MKILAFDTTNSTLSVAILFDKKLIAQKNILENNKHSEMLIPVIEECLKQARIWYQNLDAIAFTHGPGSFTGIRVGYSCAKALAITTDLPVVAISSLEVIACAYLERNLGCKKILVVNDARLEEFKDFLPNEKFILAGSAKNMIKDDLKNAIIYEQEDFIDAKNIALLAEEKYSPNHNLESSALYIREPKISQRKRK